MERKTAVSIMFALILMSTVLMSNLPTAKASETIYIRTNGSIDPSTAPISTVDHVTYTLTGNIYDTTIVVQKDNIVVDGEGHTVQGIASAFSSGMDLSGTKNVTVQNVQIKIFYYGIYLNYSSYNSISGSNITANNQIGIWLDYSSNCSISGNNITNNGDGVAIDFSYNCTVSGNNITNNGDDGVFLGYSSNNTVSGNMLTNDGLEVYDSFHNVVAGNLVDGKPLVYLEGVSDHQVGDAGQVVLVKCNSMVVNNLNLSKASIGVELWQTDNTRITGNNITNNNGFQNYGVDLFYSRNCTVFGNNITNNFYGVYVMFSSNSVVSGNNITKCSSGVNFGYSHNCTISRNIITNGESAVLVSSSFNCEVSGNMLTNNTNYGVDIEVSPNSTISGNNITKSSWYCINLFDSSNCTISGNNIAKNTYSYSFGIYYCSNCTVSGDSITNNTEGLALGEYSDYNTISGNNITNNNGEGVYIDSSSNYNRFFHNNFIHNDFINNAPQVSSLSSTNVWDDGYPSGGNYWSDYRGVDTHCGQYQNLTGSDGIGDTPYSINVNNTDHYPFMKPNGWENFPVSLETNVTITDNTIRSTAMYFTASGPTGEGGYVNATMPVGFNTTAINVFIDNRPVQKPFPIIATNGTHYFIYFEFTLSTHEIAIQFGPVHDVAVTNVISSKTVVGQSLSASISVTAANHGGYTETFKVTLYANLTSIASQNVTLTSGNSTAITFLWNTAGFAKGNYILSAYAWPIPGEINTANNRYVTSLPLCVAMVGDIASIRNGKLVDIPKGKVNMLDVGLVASKFGTRQGQPGWDPNCDLTGPAFGVPDGKVDMLDVGLVASMFGKTDP